MCVGIVHPVIDLDLHASACHQLPIWKCGRIGLHPIMDDVRTALILPAMCRP